MTEPWEEKGRKPDSVNEVGSEVYILHELTEYLRKNRTTGKRIKGLRQHMVLRVRRGDYKDYVIIDGVGIPRYRTGEYQDLIRTIYAMRLLYADGEKHEN